MAEKRDVYETLQINKNASADEIKQAYRRLAKKYHPDLNPGDEHAAQMMNEINAAYDQIKNPQPQSSGGAYGGYGTGYGTGYGGYGGAYQAQGERSEITAARGYIRMRRFAEALTALSGVPQTERGGEWFYLSAIANYNLGNRIAALDHAKRACSMEPGNMFYRQLLAQIEQGAQTYEDYGNGFGFNTTSVRDNGMCGSFCLPTLLCSLCSGGAPMCFCF